jgi:hypothetical protein
MTDDASETPVAAVEAAPADDRHDTLMTMFVAGVILLLALLVLLIVIAAGRPPAGL